MKAKSIEIVTHVYSPPKLPQYAEMLRWQFASLVRHRPPVLTTLTVCFTSQDETTGRTIRNLAETFYNSPDHDMTPVQLKAVDLEPSQLFRRAIGRNHVAQASDADVIWFTDVDYYFGPGCLEAVAKQIGPDDELCQPSHIWIHTNHAMGDEDLFRNRTELLPQVDPERFSQRRQKHCIGGVQIVGGNLARRVGYCNNSKWTVPVTEAEGFRSCRGDKAFRRMNDLQSKPLDIPNVYRLRHSRDGRDLNLDGVTLGKQVW